MEIYAWGYGDILAEALNGISMLVTQAEYVTWIKIIVLITTTTLIIAWIRGRSVGEGGIGVEVGMRNPFYPVTYFLSTFLIFMLFVKGPTERVVVVDKATGQYHYVTNVPLGIAYPLALFSTFELRMGELMETTFGVPDRLSYTNSGFMAGIIALKSAVDFRIHDERTMGNINNFSIDCVIPAILSGDINRDNLLNGDFLAELRNVNPALVTTYRETSGTIRTLDCLSALNRIEADLNAYVNPITGGAFGFLGKVTGLGTSFAPILTESLSYYLGYSGSAQSFVMQSVFMNQFLIAQTSWLQANGVSTAQAAVGTALAERQLSAQGAVSEFLAKGYIPVIKGIMTVIMVASIPIVVLLLMMGGLLYSRRQIFTGLIMVLLWLSLWHIIDVILNMIVMVKTGSLLQSVLGSGWSSMAFYKQNIISSEITRYANMVAQYYWSIPFFSLLVAGGFSMYTMNSLAGSGASAVSGASSGASAQASTGSLKLGEVGVNNIRMNTFTDRVLTSDVFTSGIVNKDNWTENNTQIGTSRGDLGAIGLEGYYGETTRRGDGSHVIHKAIGKNGTTMQNVVTDGANVRPAGANASISAPSGTALKEDLLKVSPNLVNDIESLLKDMDMDWGDISRVDVKLGENGHQITFTDNKGATHSHVIGEKGSRGGTIDYAGVRMGVNDDGLTKVDGLPVKAFLNDLLQETGERKTSLETMVQEFNEKTKGWSDMSKAMYAQVIKAHAEGKISAEDVKKAWEAIKSVEDEYNISAKGRVGTDRKGRIGNVSKPGEEGKPMKIFNKLPAKVRNSLPFLAEFGTYFGRSGRAEAGANFRGKEGKNVKEGGKVSSTNTTGMGSDKSDGYAQDFNKVVSESLRYVEAQARKLSETFSQLESKGLSISNDIFPALIESYADENGLSYSEAVAELSKDNWKGLKRLAKEFANNSEFMDDILKKVKERSERVEKEMDNVNVDTSQLRDEDISGKVEGEIEKRREEVRQRGQEIEQGVNTNIGKTHDKGESVSGEVIEQLNNRENVAKTLGALFFANSLFGIAPNKKVKGTASPDDPKGLPGGGSKPLPGGQGDKALPGGGSGMPPEKIMRPNTPEEFKALAQKYGMELTDDEAKRLLELRDQILQEKDAGKARKMAEEMKEIIDKAIARNPEGIAKIQKGAMAMAPQVEEAVAKNLGKSALKKVPLMGLAIAGYLAKERWENGDRKGAMLEIASGILSIIPGIGTGASMAVDGYLLARDMGVIDDSVSREEFEKVFNQALSQNQSFNSTEEIRQVVWNNNQMRDQVLNQMSIDPNFTLNFQGRQVRLDESGTMYDYDALYQRGLSINTQGQLYEIDTGRLVNNIDKSEFIVGRIT